MIILFYDPKNKKIGMKTNKIKNKSLFIRMITKEKILFRINQILMNFK